MLDTIVERVLAAYWLLGISAVVLLFKRPDLFRRSRFTAGIVAWGKLDTARRGGAGMVPKSWFTHFYVVGVIVNTAILLHSLSLLPHTFPLFPAQLFTRIFGNGSAAESDAVCDASKSTTRLVVQLLLEIQVIRRLLECLFVSVPSPSATMHIAHYAVGISFYIAASLSVSADCGFKLGIVSPWTAIFTEVSPFAWIGLVLGPWLFVQVSYHQNVCHRILAFLRKNDPNVYAVPKGDWFERLVCPHYSAEVIIYVVFAMTTYNNILLWLAAVFVVLNLTYTAMKTKAWYISKFPKFPRDRAAILVGIA